MMTDRGNKRGFGCQRVSSLVTRLANLQQVMFLQGTELLGFGGVELDRDR
jgi:hypothetical protein